MTTARELSMERRYDPLTPDQAKYLRRWRDELQARADVLPKGDSGRRELLEAVADLTSTLDMWTPEPSPLEAAARNALEAWDALRPPTRVSTGDDFLTAMEAMRLELFR